MGSKSILAVIVICCVLFSAVDATTASIEYEDLRIPIQEPSAKQITALIEEKLQIVEQINSLLKKEKEISDTLDELLASNNYFDLKTADIVRVKDKALSVINHQVQVKKAQNKGIEKLKDPVVVLAVIIVLGVLYVKEASHTL